MAKRLAALSILLGSTLLLATGRDPLATAIERWVTFVRNDHDTGELWVAVKQASAPVLEKAESALRAGRRHLALQRFAAAHANLQAAAYAFDASRKSERSDPAKFEALWKRSGATMRPPSAESFAGLHPAVLRALAEAAAPQVREYYSASIEYARATDSVNGLFYLGNAHAQLRFIELARELSTPSSQKPPALRSIAGEIDTLERELLATYRPPASIDKHVQFITASAAIKEARELDAAGLRHGALMRYLDGVRRFGQIAGSKMSAEEARRRIRDFERQLTASGIDHTIARLSIEGADDDPANLQAVAELVLPRYLAALQPAAPRPRPSPAVSVTLIRWPYT